MIRTSKIIFCDNEHGTGDVTFPDLFGDLEEMRQHFVSPPNRPQLRKRAKAAGWSRRAGVDYCPACTEGDARDARD